MTQPYSFSPSGPYLSGGTPRFHLVPLTQLQSTPHSPLLVSQYSSSSTLSPKPKPGPKQAKLGKSIQELKAAFIKANVRIIPLAPECRAIIEFANACFAKQQDPQIKLAKLPYKTHYFETDPNQLTIYLEVPHTNKEEIVEGITLHSAEAVCINFAANQLPTVKKIIQVTTPLSRVEEADKKALRTLQSYWMYQSENDKLYPNKEGKEQFTSFLDPACFSVSCIPSTDTPKVYLELIKKLRAFHKQGVILDNICVDSITLNIIPSESGFQYKVSLNTPPSTEDEHYTRSRFRFFSPERLAAENSGNKNALGSPQSDVWSLGILYYFLQHKHLPPRCEFLDALFQLRKIIAQHNRAAQVSSAVLPTSKISEEIQSKALQIATKVKNLTISSDDLDKLKMSLDHENVLRFESLKKSFEPQVRPNATVAFAAIQESTQLMKFIQDLNLFNLPDSTNSEEDASEKQSQLNSILKLFEPYNKYILQILSPETIEGIKDQLSFCELYQAQLNNPQAATTMSAIEEVNTPLQTQNLSAEAAWVNQLQVNKEKEQLRRVQILMNNLRDNNDPEKPFEIKGEINPLKKQTELFRIKSEITQLKKQLENNQEAEAKAAEALPANHAELSAQINELSAQIAQIKSGLNSNVDKGQIPKNAAMQKIEDYKTQRLINSSAYSSLKDIVEEELFAQMNGQIRPEVNFQKEYLQPLTRVLEQAQLAISENITDEAKASLVYLEKALTKALTHEISVNGKEVKDVDEAALDFDPDDNDLEFQAPKHTESSDAPQSPSWSPHHSDEPEQKESLSQESPASAMSPRLSKQGSLQSLEESADIPSASRDPSQFPPYSNSQFLNSSCRKWDVSKLITSEQLIAKMLRSNSEQRISLLAAMKMILIIGNTTLNLQLHKSKTLDEIHEQMQRERSELQQSPSKQSPLKVKSKGGKSPSGSHHASPYRTVTGSPSFNRHTAASPSALRAITPSPSHRKLFHQRQSSLGEDVT